MGKRTPKSTKLETYYDGQCPMCVGLVDRVRKSDRAKAFALHDMHRSPQMPFAKESVAKEIHVTDQSGTVYRGADAILKIAEQYPSLSPFVRFARTAPARMAAPVVYNYVAANRRFLWGPGARLYWLKVAVLITFCIELILSVRLWIGPRSFPTIPLISMVPVLPSGAAMALFVALFALAVLALIAARPQKYIAGFLSAFAIFCFWDQMRWQPWAFQFVFLLGALAAFSWKPEDEVGRERTLSTARLIIAVTYVYSGLQKLNMNFVESDFHWIVQPLTNVLPQTADALHAFGFAAPLLQVAFGIGLLFPRSRRVSLVLAVFMHLFILAMFGPLGQNWNDIIWPWTAAMAVFDIILFGGRSKAGAREVLWPHGTSALSYHAVAFAFFAVLPAASFFNFWDSALSAALYSGNLTEGLIYVDDAGARALPANIARYAVRTSANTHVINFQRWSIEDLNVVPYSEARILRAVARDVCAYMPKPTDLVLTIDEHRPFRSRPEAFYTCNDLRKT